MPKTLIAEKLNKQLSTTVRSNRQKEIVKLRCPQIIKKKLTKTLYAIGNINTALGLHRFSKELTVQALGPHFSSQHPHEKTNMVATLVIPTVGRCRKANTWGSWVNLPD